MPIKLIKEKTKTNVPFGYKITGHVISIDKSESIEKAAKILAKHNIGALVVTSKDRLAGILSERDIVNKVVSKGISIRSTKVGDVMTKKVVTVDLDKGIGKIHDIMKKVKFRHLPVLKGNNVVGMVSNRDLLYLRRLKTKTIKKDTVLKGGV